MLQQTQAETVIPFYHRFLQAFPSLDALARASLDEVLKVWENMGYYARARNLHAASRQVVERFGGRFPSTMQEMLSLPGIGSYTAGAILSIAFGKPVAAVDGNITRVLARMYALKDPVNLPFAKGQIHTLADSLVPKKNAGDFNQALMDLGATLCRPKNPGCEHCPVEGLCLARKERSEQTLPVKSKRGPLPHRNATAAIIRKGGKLLVVQRPEKGLLGGLWKFPGGLTESGETLEASLTRRVMEEVGIAIRVGDALAKVSHAYTHFRLTAHAFSCRPVNGSRPSSGCTGWRWMNENEIRDAAFSKADRKIMAALM
jgi:A/G-specific adenine glycosylase